MKRVTLKARDGYIYTNGNDFGKIIYLAVGANSKDYYEITKEEYNRILEEKEKQELESLGLN